MQSRPLTVAIAAGVALVALLAVDLALDRTLALDVRDGEGWRTLATSATTRYGYPESMAAAIDAPTNGSVEFRIRLDNGYPTEAKDDFEVRVNGVPVADGRMDVPPRDEGSLPFTVDTDDLMGGARGAPRPVEGGSFETHVSFEVRAFGKTLNFATLVREV